MDNVISGGATWLISYSLPEVDDLRGLKLEGMIDQLGEPQRQISVVLDSAKIVIPSNAMIVGISLLSIEPTVREMIA